jgi:hypothetical protein
MAFKVSPVAILELAALEEEAAAAAAEAPAFAALVAAVAAGGVTRRIADNIATYDLSSLRGGVSSLRAAVDGAAAVAAPRAPVDADAVLGRPPPRPGLMSLAEACGALLGLRVALVACVDGARDGSDAPTAPAGAAGGLARIEAARTARARALASLRRLPRAAAEEVDCARAFLDERWVAADLRQTMEGCLEDAPLPFPSAAARAELGAHAAFRAAEADVTARAALRASGGRLELAFLRFRRLERDGAATAATAALAALCRRHAALCRAVALSDWAAVSRVARAAPGAVAYADPDPLGAPPRPPAPGPPPPPPPPGRDMDDADWCDAWGFVADDARRKCARAERRLLLHLPVSDDERVSSSHMLAMD